jgi:hypothetical protein
MTPPDRLTVEDVITIQAMNGCYEQDFRDGRITEDEYRKAKGRYDLATQLLDTMRENERLLTAIKEARPLMQCLGESCYGVLDKALASSKDSGNG